MTTYSFAGLVEVDDEVEIEQYDEAGSVPLAKHLRVMIRMTRWWVGMLEQTLRKERN